MNPEDVKMLVDQLLKTGEILATKAFELAMRQVIIQNSLGIIFGVMLISVAAIYLKNTHREYWAKYHSEAYEDLLQALSWTAMFPGILIILSCLGSLLNPEWYAVKLLVNTFLP